MADQRLRVDRRADRIADGWRFSSRGKPLEAGRRCAGARRRGRDHVLAGWLSRAEANRRELLGLLRAIHRYRVPTRGERTNRSSSSTSAAASRISSSNG